MSKLVWDAIGERTYETGTKKGVLYPQSGTTYPKGVVWNGLTAVTNSPEGAEANALYADDIKYLNLRSAEDFKATIEAYTYPDEFAECDGSAWVATGVKIGQQARKPFGFSYVTTIGNDTEFEDHGYTIHLVWGATAAPSEKAYQTINDSPEAITFSWEIDTIPVEIGTVTVDGVAKTFKPCAHMEIDSTKVDPTLLASFEDIIYGSASSTAYLPLPAAVIAHFGSGATTYTYTKVTPVGTENPIEEEWYVRSGNEFVKSTDSEVVEGTVYYERTSE